MTDMYLLSKEDLRSVIIGVNGVRDFYENGEAEGNQEVEQFLEDLKKHNDIIPYHLNLNYGVDEVKRLLERRGVINL